MNQERLLKIILAPVVSEKSVRIADLNRQFVFKVMLDATKPEVRAAVETLFKVQVDSVQMLTVKGKKRVFRQIRGKRSDWKKAFVKLKEGCHIDFSSFAS